MYLDRASLELQAGLLSPANFPRLAAEGIAAGYEGATLRAMRELLGEPQERVLSVAASIPDVEQRLLEELRMPSRSREAAAWELVRVVAGDTVDGQLKPRDGATQLIGLVREFDDRALWDAIDGLEGVVEQWEYIPPSDRDRMLLGVLGGIASGVGLSVG